MKPTVIVIDRLHQDVAFNILRKLLIRINKEFKDGKISIFPNEYIKAFICLIDLPDFRVGIYENGSSERSSTHQLEYFDNKSCHLIFYHIKNSAQLIERLKQLESRQVIKLVHFKKIWQDIIAIPSLEAYEVEYIFELLQLKMEERSASSSEVTSQPRFIAN